MTETESRILSVLSRHQPCTAKDIQDFLPNHLPGSVLRFIKKLANEGAIVNHGNRNVGRWALAGVQIDLNPSKKASPATDNLAPARLIGKMDGNWVPPKQVMRPGADDHKRHPSLRSGVRHPYIGLMLSMRGGK